VGKHKLISDIPREQMVARFARARHIAANEASAAGFGTGMTGFIGGYRKSHNE
jgi:hypothetical protein